MYYFAFKLDKNHKKDNKKITFAVSLLVSSFFISTSRKKVQYLCSITKEEAVYSAYTKMKSYNTNDKLNNAAMQG